MFFTNRKNKEKIEEGKKENNIDILKRVTPAYDKEKKLKTDPFCLLSLKHMVK